MADAKIPLTRETIAAGQKTAGILASMRRDEPKEIAELVTRMREDHQVHLAELVMAANVKSAAVSISIEHRAPKDSLDWQRGEALGKKAETLWETSLTSMLDSVPFGRVAYEKVHEAASRLFLTYVDKLEALPFEQTSMRLTPSNDAQRPGAFDGIRIESTDDKIKAIELDADYSFWCALDETALEPHGRSRFVGSPQKTWGRRQDALTMRDVFIRRFCLGGGKAHAPPTMTGDDGEVIDVWARMGMAYEEGNAGGLTFLRPDRVRDKDGVENGPYLYDIEQWPAIQDAGPLITMIDSLDAEQLLSFGFPPKTIIEGNAVGSFALVSQQMLILLAVVEDVLSQLVNKFQRYVIDKMVELNFMAGTRPIIELVFTPLTSKPDDLAVELVKNWLTTPALSPIILAGAIDVAAVLELVGIPITETAAEQLTKLIDVARVINGTGAGPAAAGPTGPPADPATEATPQNIASALSLNGAQITAALEILGGITAGTTATVVVNELLIALGIDSAVAARMVKAADAVVMPGAPAKMGSRRNGGPPGTTKRPGPLASFR